MSLPVTGAPDSAEADAGPPLYRGKGGVWSPSSMGWAMFEFARNPYFLLVVTFIFPPYFASKVVGDPVQGQAMVAAATWIAGFICAATAPLLGAMMDRGGRRKPLMALWVFCMAGSAAMLWFSLPKGMGGLGVAGTIIMLVLAFVSYTFSEVMHNGMLPLAGRRDLLQHISAVSLGFGNGAGMLCLVLWLVFALGGRNALGVPADFNIERFVGPVMAIWFIVFVIPFFLLMPDGAPKGGSWIGAAKDLFRDDTGKVRITGTSRRFFAHIGGLFREFPEVMKYLLARIAFADALTTLLSLGGVYTTGVLQWTLPEIAIYAVYGSLFAALGSFFGGILDTKLGSRGAIALELTVIILCVVLQLSITKDTMLYGLIQNSDQAVWSGIPTGKDVPPAFASLSDVTYMILIAIISGSIAACLTSSRYMLVAMAPKHRVAEFFGLYMLSATATVWLGPLLNGIVTTVTHSQRWGMATVMILLVTGYVLFLTLKIEKKAEPEAA